MTEKDLLTFIKKIVENSPDNKARLNLSQLKTILKNQRTDAAFVEVVDQALDSIAEIRTIARKGDLTAQDVQIAQTRAENRRRHEAEMVRQGRC